MSSWSQRAQFATGLQKIQRVQAQTEQLLNRLATVTVKGFEDINAKINSLIDAQMRTEGRIKNLTSVVDRYFSEGRNGN